MNHESSGRRAARWCWRSLLPPLVLLVLVLAAWDISAVAFSIEAYLVPRPLRVWETAREHAADLATAVGLTGAAALCGFAASCVAGTLCAFVLAQSRVVQRSVLPYAIFLQTVPIVAIAPLIITWFGTGFQSVVVVAGVISLFPIINNATAGLTQIDANQRELFELHNATRWQTLVKLRLPNAVPYLVTGAKVSCGLSVVGAIVGEIYAGYAAESHGLGYLIMMTSNQLKTDYLFACILTSTLLGVTIFGSVSLCGSLLLGRWHTAAPHQP